MPPSIDEAERRFASLPSLKSTLVGIIVGIAISIFAQLILKPVSFGSYQTVNGTILVTYFGNQQVGTIAPFVYYVLAIIGLVASLFVWWFVQKRLTGLTGVAVTPVTHGVGPSGLEAYVAKLDKYLDEKLKLHGYELQNYQTEQGEFVRAVRFRESADDLLTLRVKPYVVDVKADITGDSIQAGKTVITYINTMPRLAPAVPD